MTPEKTLETLKRNASAKTQQTLDAIFAVCSEQQKNGVNDFSATTVARLGVNRGVPKAQSIRNKSGEKYRALIKSFEEARQSNKKVSPIKSNEAWIDEIPNAKHRLLTKILSSDLKKAQQQLQEIIPPKTRIHIYDHKGSPAEPERLNNQERRALEYLISTAFLNKWNFKRGECGELLDDKGNIVLKVATVDAIQKALRSL